ncbi:DUF7286 family protein [Haladaptatus sp. NG-SE-30]
MSDLETVDERLRAVERTLTNRDELPDDGDDGVLHHPTKTTTDLVAVPPGKTGVGDVDGDADERSPGWSIQSNNPFDSRDHRDDHALRRDRRSGRDDAGNAARTVRGGTRRDGRIGRYGRRGRADGTRP